LWKKSNVLAALAVVVLCTPALPAQERLTFSADRTEAVFAEGRERTRLLGNARVETENILIIAEDIDIFGENQRYLESSGGVTIYDSENDLFLTGETLFYDRELKFFRASGNAYLEDRPNEVVVKGGLIQNWDDDDLTEISVNVRIFGEDYTARGQFARYRRAAETLELSGAPEVFWKGDEYRATRIRIDIANDEIEFIGDVRAIVRQGGAEDEESADEPTAEPAAEPAVNGPADSTQPPDDAGGATDG
jgi:lipopolysaccharide export system protein LptA